MHVPLRESDDDVVFVEDAIDLEAEVAAYASQRAMLCRFDPEKGVEYQGGIAEILENHGRFGVVEDVRVVDKNCLQQALDLFDVGPVTNADTGTR